MGLHLYRILQRTQYKQKQTTYPCSNFTEPFVLFGNKIRLADVDEVYHRFGGDQRKLLIDDFNLENVNFFKRNKSFKTK